METVYSYKAKISDVVKPTEPLPPEQDQTFVCSLTSNGTVSLKFFGSNDSLISRITLPLPHATAIEAFSEPGKDYWLLRINGNQVPLVLPHEEMVKLMDVIDALDI